MATPQTSATARAAAGISLAPNQAPAPEPAPVYGSVMDTYVPIIPDPKPDDIERRFKHPTLTKIEDEPDYEQMCTVHEELFRNAIAIKSLFGGRNHSHSDPYSDPLFTKQKRAKHGQSRHPGGCTPPFQPGQLTQRRKGKSQNS